MARSLFSGLITAVAREAVRAVRIAAREAERQAKKQYVAGRAQGAEKGTQEVEARVATLQHIIEGAIKIDEAILFDSLRVSDKFKEFVLPPEVQFEPTPPHLDFYLSTVKEPGFLVKLIPGSRRAHERELEGARQRYEEANATHQDQLRARADEIRKLQDQHERNKIAFQDMQRQRNQEVQESRNSYKSGDPESVVAYAEMVLERSEYPEGFPQEFRIALVPESKELVIEYQLPPVDIVPSVSEYHHIKSRDTITEKLRKPAEVKRIYQDLVASVCLRTIWEVFEAERAGHVNIIVFNGFVHGIDSSTGEAIRPHIISVRTTRQKFAEIHLELVEKTACLRNLGAQVSRSPDELQAVKPIVDFNMVG